MLGLLGRVTLIDCSDNFYFCSFGGTNATALGEIDVKYS